MNAKRRPKTLLGNRFLSTLLCLTSLSAVSFSTQALDKSTPDGEVKLRYNVNIYGTNLGEIHTSIKKNQQRFELNSVTRAEGAASLVMGGDLKQQCNFSVQDKQIITRSSLVEKLGRKSFISKVEIDWNSKFINYNNESVLAVPEGYLVDSCNFQFAAAFTDIDFLKQNTTYVLDGKQNRLKAYVFKSETLETLKTSIGEFETRKIVLERELNPEKSFIFWVTDEHPYFPLKMVEKRKSRSRIMTIKSYDPVSS